MTNPLLQKHQRREFKVTGVTRQQGEDDTRTVDIVFATDEVVSQPFGKEKLELSGVNMRRLDTGTAPVLNQHNIREQIGVVERAEIRNGQGVATVRFSRNPEADAIYQDIQDGIRSNFSVGYDIEDFSIVDDIFVITKWTPFEISVVSVPADPNALIQRGFATEKEKSIMNEPVKNPTLDDYIKIGTEFNQVDLAVEMFREKKSLDELKEAVEAKRAEEVDAMLAHGQETDNVLLSIQYVREKKTLGELKQAVADGGQISNEDVPEVEPASDATRDFSLADLVHNILEPASERGQELHQELKDLTADAKRDGHRSRGGLIIPHNRFGIKQATRDLTTASSSGGNLIGETVLSSEFVEALRAENHATRMATILPNLSGDVGVPIESTAPTAQWVAEAGAASESDPTIGQATLAPKVIIGYTEVTRSLLAQASTDAEVIVRRALTRSIATVLEKAIFTGSGSNGQPTGLSGLSGISSTTYTNGGDPTLANGLNVIKELDDDSVPEDRRAWIANPGIRAEYRKVGQVSTSGTIPAWYNQRFLDYPAYVSANLPSTGKGTAYLADWSQVIIGLWSNVEILVNPYAKDANGLVRITAWQLADVDFGQVKAFSELKEAA